MELVGINPPESVSEWYHERVVSPTRRDVATIREYLADVLDYIGIALDVPASEEAYQHSVSE
jgi:hypothetical protein